MDRMSEAVEGAAVVLYGVSTGYKESANCRLEAQVRPLAASMLARRAFRSFLVRARFRLTVDGVGACTVCNAASK